MRRVLVAALAVLAALFCGAAPAHADSLRDVFARGNRAFARREHSEAVREYERLVEAGLDDPDVSYNLACAYGALGKYGQAIRYFERSLRLAPGDDAAEKGLAQARSALGERQAQETGEAVVAARPPLGEAIFARVQVDTLAWLLLLASWLACGSGLALLWARGELARLSLGITCGCATLLAAVSGIGLGTLSDWGRSQGRAIVVVTSASLREGPDPSAQVKGELLEGASARVLSHEGAYLHVESGSREGFVLASELGEI